MIKSMTGYGKAEAELGNGKITVEIRTLNAKGADISIKTSILPKDKELCVRQKLQQSLVRGTIDFYMLWEPGAEDVGKKINTALLKEYYSEIRTLLEGLSPEGLSKGDAATLLSSVMRIPDVVDTRKQDVVMEENWPIVEKAIDEAISRVNAFRQREGEALYKDVTSRVGNILRLEDEVESYEGQRLEAVRERLLKNLEELAQKPDPQRFEQEMIYYLEKLDINEEKVRLRQHCKYFMDTIDSEENPGKKLGFILQEMGREINTTGSKANHALIQKTVVLMKDELEKIREQSMNIL